MTLNMNEFCKTCNQVVSPKQLSLVFRRKSYALFRGICPFCGGEVITKEELKGGKNGTRN